ncbi:MULTISPECIES: hypothetical protein [Leptospira]|uniref:Uncharacterized protein n=2 Tax=Leptospira santarosai TaxID=28183 RepID=A0A0G8BHF8_9LEPT|nr:MULTISPECIES: hypothetical protein [Leptospira]AVQ12309.1 Uncharacterized protein XB16_1982 [Leptospira santarosai]AVV51272.1 Uncharacterized protein XB17_02693 [Leptospira santarosai]AVV80957.1 Uncharacterized protein XB15_03217 [Leptospira santarosai]EMN21848.1 hypothetical protein LEP1GSC063_3245 [Leptospira santarosai serovar Arenal str. MAVJ 401]EMP03542.1 hypothetical protein LEP1GSC171_1982 [Leptospira santarosai str. HAI1380]
MLTVSGTIKKGKIVLDEKVKVDDGKVLVTFIEEKKARSFKTRNHTGKALEKLHLSGIWSDRGITDGLSYSIELRKRLAIRNVD